MVILSLFFSTLILPSRNLHQLKPDSTTRAILPTSEAAPNALQMKYTPTRKSPHHHISHLCVTGTTLPFPLLPLPTSAFNLFQEVPFHTSRVVAIRSLQKRYVKRRIDLPRLPHPRLPVCKRSFVRLLSRKKHLVQPIDASLEDLCFRERGPRCCEFRVIGAPGAGLTRVSAGGAFGGEEVDVAVQVTTFGVGLGKGLMRSRRGRGGELAGLE